MTPPAPVPTTTSPKVGFSPKGLYIGGAWVDSTDGKRFETINPSNGETLGDRLRIEPHVENARALVEAGQIEPAIDQLNLVIELHPRNLEAMLLLGRVSMLERPLPEGGRGVPRASLERAELNLESAVTLAPENVLAYQELAQVRERLGKKDAAREAWTRVRDLSGMKPEHVKAAAEATEALARLGR